MNYTPLPTSKRIESLKERYLSLPIPREDNPYSDRKFKCFGTGDRWISLAYLRGWKKHADAETTRLRASFAEAEELYTTEPFILDGELLLGHLWFPDYTESEKAEYEQLAQSFNMSPFPLIERAPRKDHVCLDFDKLIRVGINGLRREINEQLEKTNLADANIYPDFSEVRRYEFYKCLLIELDAVSDLAKRYSKKAYELSLSASGERRAELLRMSEIIARVPDEPAESFYEAIQSVHFFLSTLFGLYPLGRPDRYLAKLYELDMREGRLTRELAQELIDNFCLGVSDRVFSRAACGFIVGGSTEDGEPFENELTYMFITALEHLKLPDPNGALAVSPKTSEEILSYSAEVLAKGTTHPAFYNDELIISSLVNNYGVEPCDAVNYIHATCAEMSIAGKSKSHSTPFMVNLPRVLTEKIKMRADYSDFDTLFNDYLSTIHESLIKMSRDYLIRMLEASRIGNDSMRASALIDNCIERGSSVFEGGEKYTMLQPIFIGFANAVDSMVAINELVFTEGRLTLNEFFLATEKNFEGYEELRRYILTKLPHYGNNESKTDGMAKRLAEAISAILHKGDIPLAKSMAPGTFSYINHATEGALAPATFDGRLRAAAFADGCCPTQGMDVNGPTALINSLTSWDQSKFLGGMVVNVKFSKKALADGGSILTSMLRSFVKKGGVEMQVNVVDRATLIDAQKNAEKHKNLLVRIGGFSDYFVRLTPTLQREIIERTEI